MNIAIVGGGQKSQDFLEFIETHVFLKMTPKVVALADDQENSECMRKARDKGI